MALPKVKLSTPFSTIRLENTHQTYHTYKSSPLTRISWNYHLIPLFYDRLENR